MTKKVYVHAKVEKELQKLQNQDNTPGFAAKKAEQIIQSLARGEKPAMAGKLTRNGDGRIKKCLKYDLGKGYRLICVKERTSIYVLYSGSHDSCHTWLDKNRSLKVEAFMDSLNPYDYNELSLSEKNSQYNKTKPDYNYPEMDYDDLLLEKVTQTDLRKIFQGIINSSGN